MLPKMLVIISFICITVGEVTALIHYSTMCLFMLYKITLVGEVLVTESS